jgi:uncharacterized protein
VNGLRERLALLRRQADAIAEAPAGSGQEAEPAPQDARPPPIAGRLQRLGRTRTGKGERTAADLAARLGGVWITEGLVGVDRRVSLAESHGEVPLARLLDGAWSALCQDGRVPSAEDLVFMDTETTGLAGGTGTLVFLLGLARIADGGLHVRQLFLTGYGAEPALLEAAHDWIGATSCLVSFNGKCFDAPLLATRYRLAALADPFGQCAHIDLLYPTRRAFRRHWGDCRLQTVEQRLLGFVRDGDLPGWMVPQTWFDFVRTGAAGRLPAILEHNRWDLVSLAALLPALAELHVAPLRPDADALAIARALLRSGAEAEALRCLEAARTTLDATGLLELARLHRRAGGHRVSLAIWSELAERGSVAAMECLAKYHEHVARDLPAALALAQRLQAAVPDNPAHRRRIQRLLARLGRPE